jgi:hypothetical protein
MRPLQETRTRVQKGAQEAAQRRVGLIVIRAFTREEAAEGFQVSKSGVRAPQTRVSPDPSRTSSTASVQIALPCPLRKDHEDVFPSSETDSKRRNGHIEAFNHPESLDRV